MTVECHSPEEAMIGLAFLPYDGRSLTSSRLGFRNQIRMLRRSRLRYALKGKVIGWRWPDSILLLSAHPSSRHRHNANLVSGLLLDGQPHGNNCGLIETFKRGVPAPYSDGGRSPMTEAGVPPTAPRATILFPSSARICAMHSVRPAA